MSYTSIAPILHLTTATRSKCLGEEHRRTRKEKQPETAPTVFGDVSSAAAGQHVDEDEASTVDAPTGKNAY